MQISENTIVGLTYELKVTKEGEESAPFSVEVRDQEDPFYFLLGNSGLPEKFEENLKDKNEGDNFNFVLEMEEAYGEADDDLIVNVPKEQLSEDRGFTPDMLEEGNFLPLVDEEGYSMQAKVMKDLGNELLLDFNHPLVGFSLHFDGQIHEVREASEEEIVHGHVHGEHGEEH
ncbi:MAG: FKBP-type peptidyl-prolyl cis-trans isomerase [Anditalea sp.]